jgi:hypothetical protein
MRKVMIDKDDTIHDIYGRLTVDLMMMIMMMEKRETMAIVETTTARRAVDYYL